jgi:penicillin-binding protein 1A
MSVNLPLAEPLADSPPEPPAPPDPVEKAHRRWLASESVILAIMVASVMLVAFVAWMTWALPLGKALEPMASPTLVLVSADGKPFARRGAYKEAPVDAATLPKHVTMAFVAIEDRRFYRHGGVDPRGIARAMVHDVRTGSLSQGGSTITQQLAKNAFTSGKRTFRRKAREAMIALYLEGRLSKDEILSRYLSSVYFGDGVFGLRAAARHYFDKTPEKLSIGEAAMLAGLVKAPTKLAPTEHLPQAKTRMREVLAAMVETKVITNKQAVVAARSIKLREGRPDLPIGSYFADWVSPLAKSSFDRAYGEVTVRTTLDAALQTQAERALANVLAANGDRLHATQGAVVVMRTDGQVLAMVGGRDYRQSQFNRVSQAERQPGSAFKPFVYLAALRRGATPDSLVLDAPIKVGKWSPENHESHYSNGPITLREAFAKSSNVAAVRLAQQTGVAPIQQAARDLGVTAPLPNDLTLALGTANLTLLQLTSAYAGIAGGAAPVTPYGLTAQPSPPAVSVLNPYERRGLLDMMRAVVTHGTGVAANVGAPAFGKTGTSSDYRDAYFIGFVGDLVVGVWVGNDDNSSMRRVTGGMLPAQIWRQVMGFALSRGAARQAPGQVPPPEFAQVPTEGETPVEEVPAMPVEPGSGVLELPSDPEPRRPPIIEPPAAPPPIREPGEVGATPET